MKLLIRKILKEQTSKINLLNIIKNEGIFAAMDLVGGKNNLKKIMKDYPEIIEEIDNLKGKIILNYKGRIPVSLDFEIIGLHVNRWGSNRWPVVNVIYDSSKLTDDENNSFKTFILEMEDDGNYKPLYETDSDFIFRILRDIVDIKQINGEDVSSHPRWGDYSFNQIDKIKDKIQGKKSLNENENDPTMDILNFLLRRYNVEVKNIGDEEDPFIYKSMIFDVYGEKYSISSFDNNSDKIRKIVVMLISHNVIEPIDLYERGLNEYRQKVIRAVKLFLNQTFNEGNN